MQSETEMIRAVRWCYDYELATRDQSKDYLMYGTGLFPFLLHKGKIALNDSSLTLTDAKGKLMEEIWLRQIASIYLGYDELYPSKLTKNFGALWSPLRLTLKGDQQIYLIIYGRYGLFVKTKAWFEILKALLSQ